MPSPARLALTILAVDDVARSVRFYAAALGWRQTVDALPAYAQFAPPGGEYGLGLYRRRDFAGTAGASASDVAPGRVAPAELYLLTDDLSAAIEALVAAGARPLSPRALRPWGDEAAYFADPDGHVVAVAEERPEPDAPRQP